MSGTDLPLVREPVQIGDQTFYIQRFDPWTAVRILGDLQKQFVGPLLSMFDGKEAGSPEAVTAALMGGIEKVSRDLDGAKLEQMAKRLLSDQHIWVDWDGQQRRITPDIFFTVLGDVADLLELCVAVVKTNYSSVFQRAATLIGAARLSPSNPLSQGSRAGSRPN